MNRWLGAIVRAHSEEIADLLRERDAVVAAHRPLDGGDPGEDRALEVTSSRLVAPLQSSV